MQTVFDVLINSYIENKVGISAHFVDHTLATLLKNHLNLIYADQQFVAAGTGNKSIIHQDKSVRGDLIYWLDRKHNNIHENKFLDLMDHFILYLNSSCYTGITGYEFHYTVYEKGNFYKKHIDQFINNKNRAFSMILYLNENWKTENGGELCLHHEDFLQNIAPISGTCVFFKSIEIAHEVLLTHQPRLSITGWLKTN